MNLSAPQYIADREITSEQDRQLIALLSVCFSESLNPENAIFKKRRWYREKPAHRWIMTDSQGVIRAHLAAHNKALRLESGAQLSVAGTSEVAVAPEYRGKGLAKKLLGAYHRWAEEKGLDFCLHFGDPKVYASTGYLPAANIFCFKNPGDQEWKEAALPSALWRPVVKKDWPTGVLDLQGPTF